MKVILLKHLPNVGRAGELKDVSDGFARNFLLKKKLAVVATADKISVLQQRQRKAEREQKLREANEQKILAKIKDQEITIEVSRVSASGKLFAALHPKDIIAALKKELSLDLTEKNIELPKAIKALGDATVIVRVADQKRKLLLHIIQKH